MLDRTPPKRRTNFARRRKLVADEVRPSTSSPVVSATGIQIRALRHKLDLTGPELAAQANISVGMLSKIENGDVEASVGCLDALARALNVPITNLFEHLEDRPYCKYVRAGSGAALEGPFAGYVCERLGHASAGHVRTELNLITLTERETSYTLSRRRGMNFIYVLTGGLLFRCGDKAYSLAQGDSLLFSSADLHGPQEITAPPVTFLSVVSSQGN